MECWTSFELERNNGASKKKNPLNDENVVIIDQKGEFSNENDNTTIFANHRENALQHADYRIDIHFYFLWVRESSSVNQSLLPAAFWIRVILSPFNVNNAGSSFSCFFEQNSKLNNNKKAIRIRLQKIIKVSNIILFNRFWIISQFRNETKVNFLLVTHNMNDKEMNIIHITWILLW